MVVPCEKAELSGLESMLWKPLEGHSLAYSLHAMHPLDPPGEDNHGVLRFERPGSTHAQAQGLQDIWSFKRCGFRIPRVTIRRVGKDRDWGVFFLTIRPSGVPGAG